MALVLGKLKDLYFYLNDEVSDPRVTDYLFMSNPFSVAGILGCYLYFVLNWGPNFMKNRKPFNLDKIMIIYNVIQIIACAYIVRKAFRYAYPHHYNILCQPVDFTTKPEALQIASGCHFYFILKITDLLDTVFFVLRKKNNQISFLHVYHHTGMVVLTWSATKFLPGGHSVFTGVINSVIHIVMYIYYLVTAFSSKHKNNVWWKKYITQMQIIQFFMITLHWVSLLFHNCNYPKWPIAVMIPQNFFMLALFGDFYRKSYSTNKVKINENGIHKNEKIADHMNNGVTNHQHTECKDNLMNEKQVSNKVNSYTNGYTLNTNGIYHRPKTNGISSEPSNIFQRHRTTSESVNNI